MEAFCFVIISLHFLTVLIPWSFEKVKRMKVMFIGMQSLVHTTTRM